MQLKLLMQNLKLIVLLPQFNWKQRLEDAVLDTKIAANSVAKYKDYHLVDHNLQTMPNTSRSLTKCHQKRPKFSSCDV
jgi:hypothetical protein